MKRPTNPQKWLLPEEKIQVEAEITQAEEVTSAEIKLIILHHCWKDIKVKAAELFKKHKLHATKNRNAVLILLVTTNREFLIYGDEGINSKVGQSFWDSTKEAMQLRFRQNDFVGGLLLGIQQISEKLKYFFPVQADDIDEISNEVSYEE